MADALRAGLGVSDVKKRRPLEEEQRRGKPLVAAHARDRQALQAIPANPW